MKTLKYEEVYRQEYRDLAEARASIGTSSNRCITRNDCTRRSVTPAGGLRRSAGSVRRRGGRIMRRPHSGAWGGKCCARHCALQVVVRIGVAAGKMGTGEAQDGLDLNSGAALQEQVLGNPKIYDAPVRLRKAFPNMPSLHAILVNRGGFRGAGWRTISGGPVNRERRGRRLHRLPDGVQQRFAAGRQSRTGVDKFHPGGVAVQGTSCRFLIGESGEPSQVTPVSAGRIASIGPRQPLAGSGGHRRIQRENTEANPGLQMVRAGLQHDTRIMPIGAHLRDHARPRNIQIDENIACVLLSTVGLKIHIATFQVASAQKPNRGRVRQLLGGPEPFARKGPTGLVVNQTDEVQLVWHRRELSSNTLQSDPESAVLHNRNSGTATKRRTMDFRQTARCVLTVCLRPGGRFTAPSMCLPFSFFSASLRLRGDSFSLCSRPLCALDVFAFLVLLRVSASLR